MVEDMLIGVDRGGTRIEVVTLTNDGVEHFREREDTPRGLAMGGGVR